MNGRGKDLRKPNRERGSLTRKVKRRKWPLRETAGPREEGGRKEKVDRGSTKSSSAKFGAEIVPRGQGC